MQWPGTMGHTFPPDAQQGLSRYSLLRRGAWLQRIRCLLHVLNIHMDHQGGQKGMHAHALKVTISTLAGLLARDTPQMCRLDDIDDHSSPCVTHDINACERVRVSVPYVAL